MSLARIRDEYRIPARLGARVTIDAFDHEGTIIGSHDDYIAVHIDKWGSPILVHPGNLTFN